MKPIDRPFLSKFTKKSIYFTSKEEFYQSILLEIKNILESRLKLTDDYLKLHQNDIPFSYGTRDLQSLTISTNGLEKFKLHCKNTILQLEPRLQEIDITKIWVDEKNQSLNLKIICYLKNETFHSELNIKK